ncbi:MAG: hypothetical protein KF846_04720 [Cyclobacteriaceae bacterium]|nr:hypothetical protein [Cyclobacteriaceae bacterium]
MKYGLLFKKKNKKDAEGRVYVAVYFKEQVELVSTGCTIQEQDWDKSRQRLKSREHLQKVQKIINNIQHRLEEVEYNLIRESQGRPVTAVMLKSRYKENFEKQLEQQLVADKKVKAGQRSLIYLTNQWLDTEISRFQKSTQKGIQSSIGHFVYYLQKSGQASATLNDLQPGLITGFERYLMGLQLASSSVGKTLKECRWFFKSLGYDVSGIKLPNSAKDIVVLTANELRLLETVDLESTELQKARDAFLLLCYLGMRVSDLKRVNSGFIVDGKIVLRQQKTGRELIVPIIPQAAEILHRYGNRCPKISEQKINEAIKIACQKAGINQPVNVRLNKGGQYFDVTKPKHKLISTHTGGKTFISVVAPGFGLNVQEISAITGKSIKTLLGHYMKPSLESAIEKMKQR